MPRVHHICHLHLLNDPRGAAGLDRSLWNPRSIACCHSESRPKPEQKIRTETQLLKTQNKLLRMTITVERNELQQLEEQERQERQRADSVSFVDLSWITWICLYNFCYSILIKQLITFGTKALEIVPVINLTSAGSQTQQRVTFWLSSKFLFSENFEVYFFLMVSKGIES